MIIGFSGKKQSGKSTSAHYLMGQYLVNKGLISQFGLDKNTGEILLKEEEVKPFPCKVYSFADPLKQLSIKLFGLTKDQVYGSEEHKNSLTSYAGPALPFISFDDGYDRTDLYKLLETSKILTARQFMQYLGQLVRKICPDAWVNACLSSIEEDNLPLAIISDVRFPNEVEAIQKMGKVIRLTRSPFDDKDTSETCLDDYKFDHVIDNKEIDVLTTNSLINKLAKELSLYD